MSDDRKRIVLVGASGVFGRRLAAMIARWPEVVLVLAARDLVRLEAVAADLAKTGPAAKVEVAQLDRLNPAGLAALGTWAVVDAAGPFQGQDHAFPRAVLAARAHYVDLADARDFVAGFEAALDGPARAAGRWAITGASSTPALSHAALDAMTVGWTRIDRIEAAISPGARAPRGLSVIRAILAWAGRRSGCSPRAIGRPAPAGAIRAARPCPVWAAAGQGWPRRPTWTCCPPVSTSAATRSSAPGSNCRSCTWGCGR